MLEKMFSIFWNVINPQKNLDEHYDKINKARISKPLKEHLIAELTRAKIVCSYWTLLILTIITAALAFVAVYFGKP
jgi:hypothetical protein